MNQRFPFLAPSILLLFAVVCGNLCAADNLSVSVTLTIYDNTPIAQIVPVVPDPRAGEIDTVFISFDQDVSGFDISDLTLTHNAGPSISLNGSSLLQITPQYYSINLSGLQTQDGSYTLSLTASGSGIQNFSNIALASDSSDTWIIDRAPPLADIIDISPDPRSTAVGIVAINFDKNVSGFDISDLSLRRDGSLVSLNSMNLIAIDSRNYTLDLSSIGSQEGSYQLTLTASTSGITDSLGNPMVTPANDSWSILAQPQISSIITGDSNQNGQIDQLTISFDRAVDISDGNVLDGFAIFTLASGYQIANADYAASNTTTLTLTLIESGSSDSGVLPSVSFINDGSITDTANASAALDDQRFASDGAPPVLVLASADIGAAILTLQFSESISSTTSSLSFIALADLTYSDSSNGGASLLQSFIDNDGSDGSLHIQMNAPFLADDFINDRIAGAAASIYDSANNTLVSNQIIIQNEDTLPSLDTLANIIIDEDSSTINIALSGILPSGAGSSVNFSSNSSQAAVVLAPIIQHSDPATTATLFLAPIADAFGGSSITVRITDDTNAWRERSFLCTINSVNDVPVLDALSDIVINEDAGVQHIVLTGIAAGPSNEIQVINITSISSDTTLLANPTLTYTSPANTATLSFTPIADAYGSATIFVRVSDDGTLNNNSVRSFNLTVNAVNDNPVLAHNRGLFVPVGATRPLASNRLRFTDDGGDNTLTYILSMVSTKGDLLRDGSILSIGQTFTQADINADLMAYQHNGSVAESDEFRFTLSDGVGGNLGEQIFSINNVLNVSGNLAPILNLSHSDITWTENNSAVLLDGNCTLSDADNSLGGGFIICTIINQARNGDRLVIRDSGIGAHGVSTSGNQLLFEGSPIGTWVSRDFKLIISLNAGVTPAIGQIISRHCAFIHDSQNPGIATRRVQMQIDDGAGGSSAPREILINVNAINNAPTLTLSTSTGTWNESSSAVRLDTTAVFTDTDSIDLLDGILRVHPLSGFENNDSLSVQHLGSGIGEIAAVGSIISYQGTVIASMSGGTGSQDLLIQFAATADVAAVQACIRQVSFIHFSDNPSSDLRTYGISCSDGDGGNSNTTTFSLQILAINDAPVISLPQTDLLYNENSGSAVIDNAALCSDDDSSDFNGGRLRIAFTAGAQTGDIISIHNQGTGLNEIALNNAAVSYNNQIIGFLVSPATASTDFILALNSQATPIAVQALLRQITFSHSASTLSTGTRQCDFTLSDGDGASSVVISKNIIVQDVNAAPVISLAQLNTTYTENDPALSLFTGISVSDSDSSNFDGGSLSIAISSSQYESDVLSLRSGINNVLITGNNISYNMNIIGSFNQYSAQLILIDFNSSADATAVRAVLENIQFIIQGDDPTSDNRNVQIILGDGNGDLSVPASISIAVTAVNDKPLANDHTIGTVANISITGNFSASDPENAALSYEILNTPSSGTFTLLDASTGAFRYLSAVNDSGIHSVSFRVFDGSLYSDPATLSLLITGADEIRPQLASDPPRSAVLNLEYIYDIKIDTSSFGNQSRIQNFQLIAVDGAIPNGMSITATGDQTAQLKWTPSSANDQHLNIGILVQDVTSQRSNFQNLTIVVRSTPGGNN